MTCNRQLTTWLRRFLAAGLVVVSTFTASADEITFDSLLRELIDFKAVARWPSPEFKLSQCSSYDRAEVAPDKPGWFANNDFSQYIRSEKRDGRTEQVMMDADGPGCITRFWLTTVKNKKGTLRVYLDGNEEPALTFPAYDLLSGNLGLEAPLDQPHPGYSPVDNGGNTLMLPIPYARHCKVTWEEAGEGPRYYQIDFRTYPSGTSMETFTPEKLAAARPLIEQVQRSLLSPLSSPEHVASAAKTIHAGRSVELNLSHGPKAIGSLEIKTDLSGQADQDQALRSIVLKIEFDGEQTVWCPITDFFGSGVGINALRSWYRTVKDDGTMICRWVMPYARTARVSVVNLGKRDVKVALRVGTSAWAWNERSMHFHAAWHYESGLKTPPPRDWDAIRIEGRGVYVGDTLALFNEVPTWYGEGDEKIWVDHESLPSFLGTGMEDYYDFSFAPRGLMQTPFANQVRVDQPMTQGHNVLTRTRNLDGIPFHRSFDFNFELISWKPTRLIYADTSYWYAFPGVTANVVANPDAATLPVPTLAEAIAAHAPKRWPDAIECEELKISGKSGDFSVHAQDMDPFDATRWSNGTQMLAVPRTVGDFVELEIPAPDRAPRRIVLYLTQAPDYGVLHFTINGAAVTNEFDGYAPAVQPAAMPVELGVFEPRDGVFVLRAQVAGANPAAVGSKYLFGLDCLKLTKP